MCLYMYTHKRATFLRKTSPLHVYNHNLALEPYSGSLESLECFCHDMDPFYIVSLHFLDVFDKEEREVLC